MHRYANLPSISLLRSFEAAARHESYTMAAEELGVTQGAVSRQVRELENHLGAALFRRVGRTVRLTKAGREFFSLVAVDLDNLQSSINRAIAAGEKASVLTVAVLPTFAARWLVPRLPEFHRLHPNVELEFHSHMEPFDLEEKRIDLAIHYGREDWPGARLTALCPEDLAVVMSPSFREGRGLQTPADILEAPLLHLTSRPWLWTQFRAQHGLAGRDAFPGPRFDQFAMLISGATAGLGAAILPTYLIEEELASGALVRMGRVQTTPDEGYFLATPLGMKNDVAHAFSTWIKRQVRKDPVS